MAKFSPNKNGKYQRMLKNIVHDSDGSHNDNARYSEPKKSNSFMDDGPRTSFN